MPHESIRCWINIDFPQTFPTEALSTVVLSSMITFALGFGAGVCSELTASYHIASFVFHDRCFAFLVRALLAELQDHRV